jgi:PAS domain S-box-containing protein
MDTVISEDEQQFLMIFEAARDGMVVFDPFSGRVLEANLAAAVLHGSAREDFNGSNLKKFIHPDSLPLFNKSTQIIRKNRMFEETLQHVRLDNSIINIEWRAVPFKFQGKDCVLALLRDLTKRIQVESRIKERLLARVHEQNTMLEISKTLASSLAWWRGLFIEQLRKLMKFSYAIRLVEEDSNLVIVVVRGKKKLEKLLPFQIQQDGKQTLESLVKGNFPVRISDIWSDDPSAISLRKLFENDSAFFLKGVKSWMWLPLINKEKHISVIGLVRKNEKPFSHHEAEIAITLANMAAVSLANAELFEKAKAHATLQERERLAQNLHDAVNQSLFSAGLIAEVLPRLWEIDLDETRRSLEDLRHLIRGAMAEMRALLAELRPTTLTDTELGELLLLLGNAFTGRTNIPVDVSVIGDGKIPAEIQVVVYRICQESLNNISKHAKASKVEIELRHTSLGLVLDIRDNGRGFDTTKLIPSSHYGLNMMKERAEAVGALMMITSQLDQGTKITVRWGEMEE